LEYLIAKYVIKIIKMDEGDVVEAKSGSCDHAILKCRIGGIIIF